MSDLLSIIKDTGDYSMQKFSKILGCSEDEIEKELEKLKTQKILLGWMPILNPSHENSSLVRAVIEVKISPEREGGFDRMALRISKFDEVESCYLMSGAYDLLVIVSGNNLKSVASFVSERLSTIQGVLSTSTHFLLRPYKEHGHILEEDNQHQAKPSVSP